ncbi:MAG: DUF2510 domain-containing protein [Leifsonia sp.]
MTNAPAGWYPDPEFPGQQRYWDGREWTVNRAPAATAPAPAAPATATAAAAAITSSATRHTPTTAGSSLAVLALALAILGFVLGVLPFAAWFAWLLFVPALVLAIGALVKRWPGRGQAIAALAIVATGWLISLVMGLASFGLVGSSGTQPNAVAEATAVATPTPSGTALAPASPAATPTPAPSAPPALPGVGQTVTSRSGVSFRVAGVTCGLGPQEYVFGTVAPKGQFCRIDFVVANGGSQPEDISTYDVFGYIGNARYEADTSLGTFGDDNFSTTVNPGLTVNCTVFFDVPAGAGLDRVKLITGWWGGDGATVALH